MAETIQFDEFRTGNLPECQACEAMWTDALDEVLSPADQAWFDAHIGACEPCSAMLADARLGAAWLEMLKLPRPEPSAHLLERILSQTSANIGDQLEDYPAPRRLPLDADVLGSPLPVEVPLQPYRAPVVPFRPRPSMSLAWLPSFTRAAFEPRLAMTAAMAFFSITLTLNLTGVRLDRIHVADLNPSALKRSFYEVKGDAARRYDSLRVVHEMESRVDDLKAAGMQLDVSGSAGQENRQDRENRQDQQNRSVPESAAPSNTPDRRTRKQNQTSPAQPDQPHNSTHPGVSDFAEPSRNPVLLSASSPARWIWADTRNILQRRWGRA